MLWTAAELRQQPVDDGLPAARPLRVETSPVDGLPDDPLNVVRALAHLAGGRRLVVLTGEWAGGATLISADPTRVIQTDDQWQAAAAIASLDAGCVVGGPPGAVGGGWFGLIGHATGAGLDTLRTPSRAPAGPAAPAVCFGWYDHALRHDGRRWWAEGLGSQGLAAALALAAQAMVAPPATGRPAPSRGSARSAEITDLTCPNPDEHMLAVEQAVMAIRTGEMVQTTICSRYRFHVKQPVEAWLALVEELAPGYAALVTGPWGALLGASPELYLRRIGRDVESAPIKGTAPASADPRQLAGSAKDVAENLMIVDLVRNDLSRVCLPGSVRTPGLLQTRAQSGVNHMVSRVTGRLRPDVGDAELVAATFPPGSVTGAPKLRASEVSNSLERDGRGAHTGAVGFMSPAWGLELAVTIRSIEVDGAGDGALGIGSGITVGSTPATEWAECVTKAAPLLAALGGAAEPAPMTTASRKGIADPARGLIETILVTDGRPVALADHVDRLTRSFAEVYGRPLRGSPVDVIARATPGSGSWRLRLLARPATRSRASGAPDAPDEPDKPDELRVDDLAPWPLPGLPQAQSGLRVVLLPGPARGSERHKFADRAWWAAAEADAGVGESCDAVVVLGRTGELLEGSRSCVFAVLDGRIATPPTDGRILPGTARQQLIDECVAARIPVTPATLRPADLRQAEGAFLVNSLRGVEWIRSCATSDGVVSWCSPDDLTCAAGRLLLDRWRVTGNSQG